MSVCVAAEYWQYILTRDLTFIQERFKLILKKCSLIKRETDRRTKIINFLLDVMKRNKHMTWVIGNMLAMQCYQSVFYYILQSERTENSEGMKKKETNLQLQFKLKSAL